eukprot:SM000024S07763  [mRNA]  locus=s24:291594:292220:+ [translate_table: standard]
MEALNMSNVLLTYRGISSAIVHARYADGAYLVVRRKEHKGFVFTESGMLAVVPLRLVEILWGENRKCIPSSDNLSLEEVHGFVSTSRDGDSIITASDPTEGIQQQSGAAAEANVDVLSTTGGFWTNDSDNDSDSECDADHPLTEEDLAEIAAMERRHKEKVALAKSAVETVVHPSDGYRSCQSLGVLAGGFMDEAKQRYSPFPRLWYS